jgi:hypothetical protein
MAILTFAQWSKFVPIEYRAFFNSVLTKDPWWRFVPTAQWNGGTEIKVPMKTANPTIASLVEGSTITESAGSYANMFTYLSELGGQTAIDVHTNANYIGITGNSEARAYADLAESYGVKLRNLGINGGYMTEANVTVNAGLVGVDSVDAVSSAMPKGDGAYKYTHATTSVQFKAPGSNTYGAAVDISGGDGAFTTYDGDNTLHWITCTLDISDFTGGAANFYYADAFTFQHPEEMKGLKALSDLDSNQQRAASGATGDAISIDALDELEQLVYGSNKIYVVSTRTERSIRTLKMGLGGSDSLDFERNPINGLVHNGHPILTSAGIGLNESKGGVSTLCRVYLVSLDADEGLKFLYGRQSGAPVLREYPGMDMSERSGGPISVPVFLRNIGEKQTLNQSIVRCTGSGSLWLDNTKYIGVAKDITN